MISDRPWNEIATHLSGRTYVNGVGFDMMAGEAPAEGQIALVESDGTDCANGSLSDRRVFAAIEDSAPDGVCFAADGTLWYADVPNRRCQRVAEGGAIIETVEVDEAASPVPLTPAAGCISLPPSGTMRRLPSGTA